jgi:hypothetical protein
LCFALLWEICAPFCETLWPGRRTNTCKNVRMMNGAALRKCKAAMFGMARRIMTHIDRRASALGTIDQEHFHSLAKRTSHNDLRLSRLDFAMNHAVMRSILRSEVGLPPEFATSNKRQAVGEATFVAVGAGVVMPSVREVIHQLVSAADTHGVPGWCDGSARGARIVAWSG